MVGLPCQCEQANSNHVSKAPDPTRWSWAAQYCATVASKPASQPTWSGDTLAACCAASQLR